MSDFSNPIAVYRRVAKVLEQHRRCFLPDGGAAFCSCNEWWYPDDGPEHLEWHEHAAQKVAWALETDTTL